MGTKSITLGEAIALNNIQPGHQNILLGDKMKFALDLLSPPGNVWYVNRNVLSSGDGKSWEAAFRTIGEAIAQVNNDFAAALRPDVGRNTIIYVGEGWYGEVPLALTASDCTIIGLAPGGHDPVVLYGSATPGGFDIGAGGPALVIKGSNNTIQNMGFFTHDVLYPSLRIGGHVNDTGLNGGYAGVNGNVIRECSFIRDVQAGSLGGIDDVCNEATWILDCLFHTSCKDWGVRHRTNGDTNPVNSKVRGSQFIGVPTGIQVDQCHNLLIDHNFFFDDTSDRADTTDKPVNVGGAGFRVMVTDNYFEGSAADMVQGDETDVIEVNNHTAT